MNQTNATLHASILNSYHTVSRRLEGLLNGKTGNDQSAYLNHIESFLYSLPLASDVFGLAQNRIRNARRYYQAHEAGAARYELRLLRCSLRHRFADRVAVEPRRRLRRPIG